jgi:hypothetical protein
LGDNLIQHERFKNKKKKNFKNEFLFTTNYKKLASQKIKKIAGSGKSIKMVQNFYIKLTKKKKKH